MLDAVAVDRGVHAVADAAADAAVVEREIVERIESVVAERAVSGLLARASRVGDRRLAAIRRIDDQRGEAERSRAPFVTQERLGRRRTRCARVLLDGACEELFLRQRLLGAERLWPIARDAAHVVRAVGACEGRVAPRRSRRFPIRILVQRRLLLGRRAARLRQCRDLLRGWRSSLLPAWPRRRHRLALAAHSPSAVPLPPARAASRVQRRQAAPRSWPTSESSASCGAPRALQRKSPDGRYSSTAPGRWEHLPKERRPKNLQYDCADAVAAADTILAAFCEQPRERTPSCEAPGSFCARP